MRLRQIQNGEETGLGTGATVWPACVVLIKYLERSCADWLLRDAVVCELGCGTGAAGLAALHMGARKVVLTDMDNILFLAEENTASVCAALPDTMSADRVSCCAYDWGQPAAAQEGLNESFDVILASECVLPKLYPIEPLVRAMRSLMDSNPHAIALVSYEHRFYEAFDPRDEFDRLCQLHGLSHRHIVPKRLLHPTYQADDIEVWAVTLLPTSEAPEAKQQHAGVDRRLDRLLGRERTAPGESTPSTGGVVAGEAVTAVTADMTELEAQLVLHEWGEKEDIPVTVGAHTFHIRQVVGSDAVIGQYLWRAGVILARLLLLHRVRLAALAPARRLHVVELGSGCGLTAIAAGLCGWDVVATDKQIIRDGVLAQNIGAVQCSVEENTPGTVRFAVLDWMLSEDPAAPTAMEQLREIRFDVQDSKGGEDAEGEIDLICCADCIYDKRAIEGMHTLLQAVFASTETDAPATRTQVWMTNEDRSAFETFVARCHNDPLLHLVEETLPEEDMTFSLLPTPGAPADRQVRRLPTVPIRFVKISAATHATSSVGT